MKKKISIVVISPEVYGLDSDFDELSEIVHRGSGGGMGDVVKFLINGLYSRGVDVHYVGPSYKKIALRELKKNGGKSIEDYFDLRYKTPHKNIHLLDSKVFNNLNNVYENPLETSVAMQDLIGSSFIRGFTAAKNRKVIFHGHDQFVGSIAAKIKSINLPYIHHLHNIYTENVPYEKFAHFDFKDPKVEYNLCKPYGESRDILDEHATAIKNAFQVISVGDQFAKEVILGRFDEVESLKNSKQTIIEIKEKAKYGQLKVVPNAISPDSLPENQSFLSFPFGPKDKNSLYLKRKNKLDFQKIHGLEQGEDKFLVSWTSRLDQSQKGIEDFIEIIPYFLNEYPNSQFAVIADSPKDQKYYEEKMKSFMRENRSRFYYSNFNKIESEKLYSQSDIILGASRREPFGLYILQAICAGSLPVVPDNGGSLDIVENMEGNKGNGFIYEGLGSTPLKNGLERALNFLNFESNESLQNKMSENMIKYREKFSVDNFIDKTLEIYDLSARHFGLYENGYTLY